MLSSKLLRKNENRSVVGRTADRVFGWVEAGYVRVLQRTLRYPVLAAALVILAAIVTFHLLKAIPQEFVPPEDRGTFFVQVRSAEGASFESNARYMREVEAILMKYLDRGDIDRLLIRTPGWGNSAGVAIVGSIPFDQRDWSTFDLMEQVQKELAQVSGVRAFGFMRSGISGGGGRPVQFVLQGNTYEQLAAYRDILLDEASKNPNLLELDSDYKETLPQLLIRIDQERASDLGVSVGDIGRTLETMLGQRRATTYIDRGEEYDVILEGERSDYRSPTAIDNIYVRSNATQSLIPLSNLVTIEERATAGNLNRFNRMRSITIEANLAEGYSLGEALSYLENIVREKMPDDVSIAYKGESQLYKDSGSSVIFVFILALVIAYLVLAAQFESFVHPFVIMLMVPLAILGAMIGLYLADLTLNIYSQIGIVMLIGLAAKNGILIVEFSNQLRDAGMSFDEAVVRASQQRLRPIVMTAFTTLMSAVPLILGSGPGAESRMVIGVVIFSGVALSAFLTIFVIPSLYSLLARNTTSPMKLTHDIAALEQQYPDRRAD